MEIKGGVPIYTLAEVAKAQKRREAREMLRTVVEVLHDALQPKSCSCSCHDTHEPESEKRG